MFRIWLQSFEWKIENKNDLRNRSLIVQDWHLALEMPILGMAHVGRERVRTHLQNNIKTNAQQLKLSKTDPSTWP
jgi:hypothetical protein